MQPPSRRTLHMQHGAGRMGWRARGAKLRSRPPPTSRKNPTQVTRPRERVRETERVGRSKRRRQYSNSNGSREERVNKRPTTTRAAVAFAASLSSLRFGRWRRRRRKSENSVRSARCCCHTGPYGILTNSPIAGSRPRTPRTPRMPRERARCLTHTGLILLSDVGVSGGV